ncbi:MULTISPECIES: ABC transporter permease [unclassified Micromonospora]|uniref:ABC transporter permease n=1 Tax=unclassified Micromonospora TaxID=2617518 RepID=UPI0010469963|nr:MULTISPECIES: ABC transporter permease [unclassified Micromonospora]TDB80214.1 ABC transporter permease [Micromonospora sp. KC721]TDC85815.1 ABC transporter permease [Micromonospora sp. KC606]
MLRAMLRDLRAHLGRVVMTLAAIVLGVAFVVATWVVSDSAAATVGGAQRTDLAALVHRESEDPTATDIPADVRDRLARLPGVTRAEGVREGYAALVRADGKLGATSWPDAGGTDWDGSQRFTLSAGRGPQRAGEVALEQGAAAEAGLTVGDSARVLLGGDRSDTATVVGVFTYRPAGHELDPAVAYDADTAARLLRPRDAAADVVPGFARIELSGPDERAVIAAAQAELGPGFEVESGSSLRAVREQASHDAADTIRKALLAFAAVALMAGVFVIANTFTMLVTQRTRQFALLRAVGARRRQVRRAVLAEAVVLGLVGSTVGVVLGVGLGLLAMRLLPVAGTVAYAVSPWAVLVGYLVGVVVTVVSAYGSARRAARVSPMAALRTDAVLPRRSLVLRTVLGMLAVAGGVAMVAATSSDRLTESTRALAMSGAVLAWVGVLLIAPVLVVGVLRPLTGVLRSPRPVTRIALRNAVRDPRRTAATASALMIGLSLVCAFATVGQTLTDTTTADVRASVPADAVVLRAATFGTFDDTVRTAAAAVPGVTGLAAPRSGAMLVIGPGGTARDTLFTSLDAAALGSALRVRVTAGDADLRRGVVLDRGFAAEAGLHVGDRVRLRFDAADAAGRVTPVEVPVTVAGLREPSELLHGQLLDDALLPDGVARQGGSVYAVGADAAALRTAMERSFAQRPDVLVQDREQVLDEVLEPFQLVLGLVYVLLGAAVVIAVFGVVNTLALSVLERTRELGVFRALGASRALVRRTVRRESVVISLYGGVLGIGVGVLLGGVMQYVILANPVFAMSVPWLAAAVALAGMALVGVLAALWPARRAARADILAAIATQ